jgi:hypothetical protein
MRIHSRNPFSSLPSVQIHITQDDSKNIFIKRYYDISPLSISFGSEKLRLTASHEILN